MKKIGLLGGSFDPIHLGHLEMAKQARKQLGLDEVWFVLSADTPLKDRKLTSYKDRKKMLDIALRAYRKFKVCCVEEHATQKNYTIDTIRTLKKMHRKFDFHFIIGADQVQQLAQWKDIDSLQEEVRLCAFERDGYQHESKYKIIPLSMKPMSVSSTDIRNGNLMHLHPKVKQFIIYNVLYDSILNNAMSEHRYLHSLSVAKVCQELARSHGLDEEIAYLCGVYHDINKEFTLINIEDSKTILARLKPDLLKKEEGIWHGFIGSYICMHNFGIQDTKILHAIEHHVLGKGNDGYTKILYLADKLEPTRKYDTSEMLAYAHKDLNGCFKLQKELVEEYHEKRN